MKWQRALNYGGSIKGKKNPKLCKFHLDRCLRKREQIEAELEKLIMTEIVIYLGTTGLAYWALFVRKF